MLLTMSHTWHMVTMETTKKCIFTVYESVIDSTTKHKTAQYYYRFINCKNPPFVFRGSVYSWPNYLMIKNKT